MTDTETLPEYEWMIPGEVTAEAFGLRLVASVAGNAHPASVPAKLRAHKPGDRARLRYSLAPKRMKEILERLKVRSDQRKNWPVLEWQGEIVWMRGAELESRIGMASGLKIEVEELP
jgi:tRNA(Ile)-lysidine synthase